MKKSVIVIAFLFVVFLGSFGCATNAGLTTLSSSLSEFYVVAPQNVYSYEITFDFSGTINSVVSNGFLSSDGASVSDIGYSIRGNNVSVYESRLDNTQTGLSSSGDVNLFNISHSGSLTLKSVILLRKDGSEELTLFNNDLPQPIIITSTGGGGITVVQHYTLKVVSPGDVTLPKEGVIQVPVSIQNPGNVALKGIHLAANITFNNLFSQDIIVNLAENDIPELAPGESKEMIVTINANTKKQGIYKVTIYATVDEPKFSDWGEFYIEFKKTSQSDVDDAITAAEKTVSENPECSELFELITQARKFSDDRKFTESAAQIQQFNSACEAAIYKKSVYKGLTRGLDQNVIIYVIIATVIALALGIGFYVYKRYKFSKPRK